METHPVSHDGSHPLIYPVDPANPVIPSISWFPSSLCPPCLRGECLFKIGNPPTTLSLCVAPDYDRIPLAKKRKCPLFSPRPSHTNLPLHQHLHITSEHKHANKSKTHHRLDADHTGRPVPDWSQRSSQVSRLSKIPGKADMMAKLQIPLDLLTTLGVIEISVAVLYLIPRTAFLGAILTTGYLGGAVWTHLRVGEPWFFPIIVGVLMWLGLALRHPVIFRLLLGQESLTPPINDAAHR